MLPPAVAQTMPQPGSLAMPPATRLGHLQELADPDTVQKEKEKYARDLDEQLRRGVEVLGEAHRWQTGDLHARAKQEQTRYNLAVDQKVKQQELLLSQEYNEKLMKLQQVAQAKRAELELQATGLMLEFQQRKVQEEFLVQQVSIQQQHQEAQKRLADEMHSLGLPPDLQADDLQQFPELNLVPNMSTPGIAGGQGRGLPAAVDGVDASRLRAPASPPPPGVGSYVPSPGGLASGPPSMVPAPAPPPRGHPGSRSVSVLRSYPAAKYGGAALATSVPALAVRGARPSTTAVRPKAAMLPGRAPWMGP